MNILIVDKAGALKPNLNSLLCLSQEALTISRRVQWDTSWSSCRGHTWHLLKIKWERKLVTFVFKFCGLQHNRGQKSGSIERKHQHTCARTHTRMGQHGHRYYTWQIKKGLLKELHKNRGPYLTCITLKGLNSMWSEGLYSQEVWDGDIAWLRVATSLCCSKMVKGHSNLGRLSWTVSSCAAWPSVGFLAYPF